MKKTLIKNADWVITMDDDKSRIKNGDILICDNAIQAVGNELDTNEIVDEVIDARGKVAIPGFVNTHHHCWQSLVRNIHVANGLKLEPWLAVVYDIFQDVDARVVEAGAYVGLGELLKTGCTTSMDHHYVHPAGQEKLIDAQIDAAKKLGIRFHPTRGNLSIGKTQGSPHVPDTLTENVDQILNDYERLIGKYHDDQRFAMTRVGLAPCWHQLDSTEEVLKETLQLARKHKVQFHSHLAESAGEVEACLELFGCRPVELVRRLDWLGEDVYYAHCVQLNDEEVKLLAETKTGIAHCPISNMFLNSGVCRVPDLSELGASIGLGVDGAASNNASNMMTELRTAYLVHRLTYGVHAPTAEQILEIATSGGAKVLGRDDIGSIAPNKAADIVLMDWDQLPYAGGKNDPVACIVMSGDSRLVHTVMVNGQIVVADGKLISIDERTVTHQINQVGKNLLQTASERIPSLKMDL
ncbi:MAG: amidohydrolase family protein [Deltaproteobacteria bacterium]|jgi:8-oxoguanine deaminase|nr:amidohydrolase family protein [Deltaproteobacteria bacterium]